MTQIIAGTNQNSRSTPPSCNWLRRKQHRIAARLPRAKVHISHPPGG